MLSRVDSHNDFCSKCKFPFIVNEGRGFAFHLHNCDACGEDKAISFDELGGIALKVC